MLGGTPSLVTSLSWSVLRGLITETKRRQDSASSYLQAKYAWDRCYKPNYAAGMDHFLLHLGGKGVLEGLQKALSLPEKFMAPAYATLWRFGNMSAASTWCANCHRPAPFG